MNRAKIFLGFNYADIIIEKLNDIDRIDLEVFQEVHNSGTTVLNRLNNQRYDCIVLETPYQNLPYSPQTVVSKIRQPSKGKRTALNRDTPIIFTGTIENYRLQGVPRDVVYVPFQLGDVRGEGDISSLESKIKELCRIR